MDSSVSTKLFYGRLTWNTQSSIIYIILEQN